MGLIIFFFTKDHTIVKGVVGKVTTKAINIEAFFKVYHEAFRYIKMLLKIGTGRQKL